MHGERDKLIGEIVQLKSLIKKETRFTDSLKTHRRKIEDVHYQNVKIK